MLDRDSVDRWITEYTEAVLTLGAVEGPVEDRLSMLLVGKTLLVNLIMSNVENNSRIPSVSNN